MGYLCVPSFLGLALLASCAPSRVTDGFRARPKSDPSVAATVTSDPNVRLVSRSEETFGAQPKVDPALADGAATSNLTVAERPGGQCEAGSYRAKAKLDPSLAEPKLEHVSEIPKAAAAAEFQAKPKQKPGGNEPDILPRGPAASPLQGELKIHFIQVGQGDCTLVQCPNGTNILVDCGSLHEKDPAPVKAYLEAQVGANGRIDSVFVSHPDADHYNMLPYVLSDLQVGQVFMVGQTSEYRSRTHVTSATSTAIDGCKTWFDGLPAGTRMALDEGDIDSMDAPSTGEFDSGDVSIWVVAAGVGQETNDRSIALLVSYGDFDTLLMADGTFVTENAILSRYDHWWLDVECLKLGHHGSRITSTSQNWIDAALPEMAIASAAFSAKHGHPNDAIRARVEAKTEPAQAHALRWWKNSSQGYDVTNYAEAIYSTATNGTIVVTSDGPTTTSATGTSRRGAPH